MPVKESVVAEKIVKKKKKSQVPWYQDLKASHESSKPNSFQIQGYKTVKLFFEWRALRAPV